MRKNDFLQNIFFENFYNHPIKTNKTKQLIFNFIEIKC
jgi:hypothetical protein